MGDRLTHILDNATCRTQRYCLAKRPLSSLYKAIEITPAVFFCLSIRGIDDLLLIEATQKYFFLIRNLGDCSPVWETGRFDRFPGVSHQFQET